MKKINKLTLPYLGTILRVSWVCLIQSSGRRNVSGRTNKPNCFYVESTWTRSSINSSYQQQQKQQQNKPVLFRATQYLKKRE